MGLVDYSSEGSDAEEVPNTTAPAPKPSSAKPAFQKVVDKSAPNRIRINLPSTAAKIAPSEPVDAEPPAKRPRLGAGGGFNSFLPAAKKPVVPNAGKGPGTRGRGLGSGVSLKTGSEAAFSREPVASARLPEAIEDAEPPRPTTTEPNLASEFTGPTDEAQAKPKGKVTMFRPLSVARKPPKKKPVNVTPASTTTTISSTSEPRSVEPVPTPKPKVSLFSMDTTDEVAGPSVGPSAGYQPLLYGAEDETPAAGPDATFESNAQIPGAHAQGSDLNSLGTIADDLNLTASQRRQLFGRGSKNPAASASATAINVVNFNTDAEYNANEELRAAGETPEQQHKAVRTVNASGRNSLRSLVNSVASQGDALEDHFAKGRRNQREAGSKYGW